MQSEASLIFWVFVQSSCEMTLACGLRRAIQQTGWIISTNDVNHSDIEDMVANSGTLFIIIHKGSTASYASVHVVFLPITKPKPLASFIYAQFNKQYYPVSVSHHHEDFSSSVCLGSDPVATATLTRHHQTKCIQNIHRHSKDIGVSAGLGYMRFLASAHHFVPITQTCFHQSLVLSMKLMVSLLSDPYLLMN